MGKSEVEPVTFQKEVGYWFELPQEFLWGKLSVKQVPKKVSL